ncbi:hypothetical protein MAP00_005573 [Monascus purpureus]|nr:hypothetical protein MAP00_005573 [Monascus purpureus]
MATKHKHWTPRFSKEGKWMPQNPEVYHDWLKKVIIKTDQTPEDLHPVLEEFRNLLDTNARAYMLITSMFQEVPRKAPYCDDPMRHPMIRDPEHMLQVFNHLISSAPTFNETPGKFGLIGLPINAVLDYPMGTASGYAAFLDPDINAVLQRILDAWGDFLRSPASASVLDPSSGAGSWFGESALDDLTTVANAGRSSYAFDEMFICDPTDKHHGFKSWDDFFTRQFREGVRPVAAPDDDRVIANACESQPFRLERDVKARDQFWAKSQPYSVLDILHRDEYSPEFVGGTIYQAFLSALSYHRWHSPVTGKIVKAYVVPGTYYSEPLFESLADPQGPHDIDVASEVTSQGYLSAAATRALIFIEADNPAIGLMVFVGIGMAEVSTCDITVRQGQKVKKGDQLGMFHFGGSTHCLLFRKGVNVDGFPEMGKTGNIPVRSCLAVVT